MGLKTTGRQLPMRARLSRAINYGAPFRLEITDETSRMVVLEIELDAEAFADFMSNREARGVAGVTTALDRIGLVMQNGSETRPRSEYGNQMAADHDAQKWAEVNGWTSWTARPNNVGNWVFTGRRWIEPPTTPAP